MEYTLHKLPEGFIITNDEEIKENDLCVSFVNGTNAVLCIADGMNRINNSYRFQGLLFKVIAQQDQIIFSDLKEDEQKEIGWFEWKVELEMDFVHTDHVEGGFDYFPKLTNDKVKILKLLNK